MGKVINIFGDSIVWGAGDIEKNGWASRLKEDLKRENHNDTEVYNLGISGADTDRLLRRFLVENEFRNPNVIIIAIGINDSQYIGSEDNPRVSLGKFEENLVEIIKQARGIAEDIVFIGLTKIDETKLMPIPWNPTLYSEEKNALIYNDKIKEVCEKNSLLFLDMQDLLDDSEFDDDGLHPNSKGHEKMFQKIKNALVENKII